MIEKYKQRPTFQVEAIRWTGLNTAEVEEFVNGKKGCGCDCSCGKDKGEMLPTDPEIEVPSLESTEYLIFKQTNGMTEKVLPNDYVVKEGEKDFYVYSPELFIAKYETLDPPDEPVGWYNARTPDKVYAVQYTGKNVKQIAEFLKSERIPEADPDTGEIEFSILWTFTKTISPGDYVAKTVNGIRLIDRDEFREQYLYVIPDAPEPEPEPIPDPDIDEPDPPEGAPQEPDPFAIAPGELVFLIVDGVKVPICDCECSTPWHGIPAIEDGGGALV